MSNIPKNLLYSKDHEWCLVEGDIATIGITDFAQSELGDVVYVDLPAVGTKVTAHQKFGEIESVKAVSDIYSPVSGEIIEVNNLDDPAIVNSDAYNAGWMIKVKMADASELQKLLSADDYSDFISKL